ncbi:xanthine dehydrogenase family protein subunit M [Sphingomonas ginkgonis]|uniref:Xanthine dehydrogenase family protein subunit M n=1 Tax=Sphingomonas ginkgonis TaxID=2315330 RepID=A0A429VCQ4_9SPHN|nr:xanthine dehydrogenase family protein subunit M [Sphingomonas ginkgonis]RST31734.1 xanthine dehydrogenase family protein subunit M [Sphingomonas ginkgonis]
MRPFHYVRAADAPGAVRLAAGQPDGAANRAPTQFIAGGTTMLDLMKLGSMQPSALVDINPLDAQLARIEAGPDGLRLGALVKMSQAADDPLVRRDYPVIAESLMLAASAQLRNMASLAGNVLQRTRCQYFRDPSWKACNKRDPGSGCAALDGVNRKHAVLGVSGKCIAEYPGDFAQALVALDASVELLGPGGQRRIPFAQLHRSSDTPETETVLAPGELITDFLVPAGAWTRRSTYLKVRDRQSYEFAVASAAVALDLDGANVRQARIGLGGVAYRPWRAADAERLLAGRLLDENSAAEAARAAFAGAAPREHNRYKIELGQRTLVRALLQARDMRI